MISKILVFLGIAFAVMFGMRLFRSEEEKENLIFPPLSEVEQVIIERREKELHSKDLHREDLQSTNLRKVLRTVEVDRLYEKLNRARPKEWRKMIGNFYVEFVLKNGEKVRLKVNGEYIQSAQSETAFSIKNFEELCDF